MDLQLERRNCIVLGGSRGIGRAIVEGLVAEGAHVAFCGRDAQSLDAAASALRARGATVLAKPCDVADPEQLRAFLDEARTTLRGVDVLVHNASALAVGPDAADWEASLRVDLMAAVHACNHVLPWMIAAGGGSILFVSSINALEAAPLPDHAYTTVKAAQLAYAKKLSALHAAQGVRVNVIAPGSTDFPGGFWQKVRAAQPALYETVRSSIPAGRFGIPEEIADAAVFLVSPRARWITGECLAVDGGQHRAMR